MSTMSHMEREKVWMEEMREGIRGERTGGDKEEEEGAEREEEEEGAEREEEGQEGVCLGKRPIRAEERKTRKQRRRELMRRNEVSELHLVA